jgi:hypothetical protein
MAVRQRQGEQPRSQSNQPHNTLTDETDDVEANDRREPPSKFRNPGPLLRSIWVVARRKKTALEGPGESSAGFQ